MWKTLRGLGFVFYANGNGHGGQSFDRRQAGTSPTGRP